MCLEHDAVHVALKSPTFAHDSAPSDTKFKALHVFSTL